MDSVRPQASAGAQEGEETGAISCGLRARGRLTRRCATATAGQGGRRGAAGGDGRAGDAGAVAARHARLRRARPDLTRVGATG